MFLQPAADDGDNVVDLLWGQGLAFGDLMPFLQTGSAAGGGGVLGDEDGVIAHGGLFAVVGRLGRGQALGDEVAGMGFDGGHTLGVEVPLFLGTKFEAAPEFRAA